MSLEGGSSDPYSNFTSLPRAEEQTFVVYEQKSRAALKRSRGIAVIAGAILFVVTVAIALTMGKEHKKSGFERAQEARTKQEPKAKEPAAAPEKAKEPAADKK